MSDPGPWSPPLPPPTPRESLPPPVVAPPAIAQPVIAQPVIDQSPVPTPVDGGRGIEDRNLVVAPRSPAPHRRRSGLWWLAGLTLIVSVLVGIVIARRDPKASDSGSGTSLATTQTATTAGTEPEVPATAEGGSVASPTLVAETAAPPTTPAPPATGSPASDPSTSATTAGPPVIVGGAWPNGVALTVATPVGARLVSALGETPLSLGGGEIAVSFPDGRGIGVMYQPGNLANGSTDPSDILRVRPDGTQIILYPAGNGETLRLHDVRVVDGRPEVLYSSRRGNGADNSHELLFIARPVQASAIQLGEIGGWESGTSQLHFGGDLIVGESFDKAGSTIFTMKVTGEAVPPPTLLASQPFATDCADCPHHFTVDPAGTRLGWIAGHELVIADRATGAEVARVPLPDAIGGDGGTVADLQLGEGVAVVNLSGANNTPLAATVIDFRGATPTFTASPVAGHAELT